MSKRMCKSPGCPNEAHSWTNKEGKTYYKSTCKTCEHLKSKYGITLPERTEMYVEQEGKCKICESEVTFSQGLGLSQHDAVVDHDHIDGKVRGILCGSCNNLLGRAQDSVTLLESAIKYIEDSRNET